MTFKVSRVRLNGDLNTLDHLGLNELDQWMVDNYGKYATVQVDCSNGKSAIYTDNGTWWEKV